MAFVNTGRKSGFIRRGGVMRRESMWFTITRTATVLGTAGSVALITSLNAAALALRPFTIVRTRGLWNCRSDQTGALEAYATSFGMAVVSDQSVAIGVTAIPTPETDRGSDLWFVYEDMASQFLFISGVGVHPNAGEVLRFDSKAMRKVEDGQDIVSVIENFALAATGTTNTISGRLLIKLH